MALGSTFDLSGKRVWVAGHRGMVGSAIVRRLEREGVAEILTTPRREVDLLDQTAVHAWVAGAKPDAAFIAAARVGGIHANDAYPAEFLYQNLMIGSNCINAAHQADVKKLLFLGSSCIYPKFAEQPISETSLLTGPLEPTNQWYAVAKIAGIKLCQAYRKQYGRDFISAMPTNLYGPGDNYHRENSHVIPATIRKVHEAKEAGADSFEIWGTGSAMREFMHVDDCADALVHIMQNYSDAAHINVGTGEDVTIEQMARTVAEVVGFKGRLTKDTTKPDGTPRKLMDVSKLRAMGWSPRYELKTGLQEAYRWFLAHRDSLRES